MMPSSNLKPPHIWALLIGVDFYMPPLPGLAAPFSNLHGCVNDINAVGFYLLNERGIPPTNITTLTASVPVTADDGIPQLPTEPPARWPTYSNIISAFKRLTTVASPGDLVYIHYSGHGSRYHTLYPVLKGEGGKDEVLCPTDIKSGGYPLRDVHIAYLLDQLVRRGLILTIVLDSCHSGGATRVSINGQEEIIRTRGQEGNDLNRFPGEVPITGESLGQAWEANGTSADDRVRQAWLLEPTTFEFFAACRPNEVAYEVTVDGRDHGALTYAFITAMRDGGGEITHAMLHRRVNDHVKLLRPRGVRIKGQEPTLAGNGQRYLFSTVLADSPSAYVVPVTRVARYDAHMVRLRAGKAHGVLVGEVYAVFPWNTQDLAALENAFAFITVTSVGALISKAVISGEGILDWPAGSQAVLVRGSSTAAKRLQLMPTHDLQAQNNNRELMDRFTKIDWPVHRYRPIALVYDESGMPDFYVAINSDSLYELWDSSGRYVTMVPPSSSIDEILDGAVHVSRYNMFLSLKHRFLHPTVRDKVEFNLKDIEIIDGLYTAKHEETVEIHFNHTSGIPLHLTIFEFSASGSVTRVWPENTDFETLDANDYRDIPWVVEVPEGLVESVEIYKVFVTMKPTSFRVFEMVPPVGGGDGTTSATAWSKDIRCHDEGVDIRAIKRIEEPWEEDKEWEVWDLKIHVTL